MLARVVTVAFDGVEARRVDVEVQQVATPAGAFAIVGLPDKAVAESRERVRGAFAGIGLALPPKKVIANLAPADLPKEGSHFDLPIALALLASMGVIAPDALDGWAAVGELGLDGQIAAVGGTLPAAMAAGAMGLGLICPEANGPEAAWAGDTAKLLGSLIVMLRAHEESATKSQRVRAAWERKRRDVTSAKLTMICPAWLILRPDRSAFEVIEDRAEVVRTILRETAAGIGKAKVAARLNERGVQPFGRGDGWHSSYVQKVLASDATRGFYQPHILRDGRRQPCGEPVPDYFPRIADDGLIMRARAAIVSRRRGRGGRTGAEFPNLLQGIGRCADCDGVMVGVSKGGGERYLACAAARRSHGCENRTLFNLPEAERVFTDAVHAIDPSRDSFDHSSSADLLRAREEEARLSSRLTALLTAFGSDSTAEITNAIAEAREALSLARSRTARFTEAVLVETYGARLADVRDAVSALRASEGAALPSQDAFLLRARVAHAARAASLSAIFQRDDRTVALFQEDRIISDRFSCTPTRSKPQRDPLGRFAESPSPGPEHDR